MRRATFGSLVVLMFLLDHVAAQPAPDTTTHAVQFVTVEPGVKLEVLDWGGPAEPDTRTLVLLAGLSDNAHRFDPFAVKLTDRVRKGRAHGPRRSNGERGPFRTLDEHR